VTTASRKERRFDIRAAKARLRRSLTSSRKNELSMYRDLRDAGLEWIAVCAWLDNPAQHGGKRLSAEIWARKNAPIGKRWLDEHADFARDWPQFTAAWKWAEQTGYAPNRRPSLRAARELINYKKRVETYQTALETTRTPVLAVVKPEAPIATEKQTPNDTTTVITGDVVEVMRKHVADGEIDLAVADGPYFMQLPDEENKFDHFTELPRSESV
jgi:hypothetical protein